MTRTNYPLLNKQSDGGVNEWIDEVTRLRELEDISDFTNLSQVFVSGRTTTRVPSTPSDVLPTDNVGDIVTDGANGFRYTLIDNGSGLIWERTTLNTSW